MSYQKAEKVLPLQLVLWIQQYIDGETIYIPRKEENKKIWGADTTIRSELAMRNSCIYEDYSKGLSTAALAEKYCLSIKSIQRIVLQEKNKTI